MSEVAVRRQRRDDARRRARAPPACARRPASGRGSTRGRGCRRARAWCPWSSSAPTVITYGSLAGENVTPSRRGASLPAAATTTMPVFQADSTAASSGSVLYDSAAAEDSDRLITRMLYCGLVVDRELDPVDHVEDGGVAVVVRDLDRDQVRAGRDAHVAAVVPVAARYSMLLPAMMPGHVRAVAVLVGRVARARVGHGRRDHARALSSRASGSPGCRRRCRCRRRRRRRRGPRAVPGAVGAIAWTIGWARRSCQFRTVGSTSRPGPEPAWRRRSWRRRSGRCSPRSCPSRSPSFRCSATPP